MVDYSLDSVIKEYLIETLGDAQMNRYARYYALGVSFLRENSYDMTGGIIPVELPINDDDTVDLPSNYLNYVKIGLCGRDGVIYALGHNDNLCLDKNFDICGRPVKQQPNNDNISGSDLIEGSLSLVVTPEFYASHFRNGQMMGRFFGQGGGNNANGYFRIDKASNQLKLNAVNCQAHSVLIEYIADISTSTGDYNVHPFILETLKAWLFWKSIQRDRNHSLGEKQLAEADYWKSYKTSRMRFNSVAISEWKEAIRSGNLGSPKF